MGRKMIYLDDAIDAIEITAEPEQHGRIFQEIVVEYPSISTYPEYEGKPYFSIKYVEDGQGYIGYGTYNSKVLSEYLKEYFIQSAQPAITSWLKQLQEQIASEPESISKSARLSLIMYIIDEVNTI